jgi:hypothetical protein
MARYDRIARLDPPSRSAAFPGWLALRDLDGRERDPELGRRAQIRFLALRPAHRLLAIGVGKIDGASLARQVAVARSELERLPEEDPERAVVADYLDRLTDGDPGAIVEAGIAVGAACLAAGHGFAAEEFYRTADEMAEAHCLDTARISALRSLGQLNASRGEWTAARADLEEAMTLCHAGRMTDADALGGILRDLAVAMVRAGDTAAARDTVAAVLADPDGADARRIAGIGAAALCALELAEGRAEAAVEAGWRATEVLAPTDPTRARALLDLAAACRQLRLREAAEACLLMVYQVSSLEEAASASRTPHRSAPLDRVFGPAGTVSLVEKLLEGPDAGADADPYDDAATLSKEVRAIADRIASMGRERVPSA